jgi:hypothetical protein
VGFCVTIAATVCKQALAERSQVVKCVWCDAVQCDEVLTCHAELSSCVAQSLVVDAWKHTCDEHRVKLHLDRVHGCGLDVERVAVCVCVSGCVCVCVSRVTHDRTALLS